MAFSFEYAKITDSISVSQDFRFSTIVKFYIRQFFVCGIVEKKQMQNVQMWQVGISASKQNKQNQRKIVGNGCSIENIKNGKLCFTFGAWFDTILTRNKYSKGVL
jgi:hypothetical protein